MKQLQIDKYTHFLQENELKSLLASLQKLREICDDFGKMNLIFEKNRDNVVDY